MMTVAEWLASQEREAREQARKAGQEFRFLTYERHAGQAEAYEAAHAYVAVGQARENVGGGETEPYGGPGIRDPLVEIVRKPGKEPCGECHIRPGETCDICGAKAAAEQSPASPAGGLISLSAGATPDEVANAVMQLDWAKPSKALQWRDYEDTVKQRFRDVEAAVAALVPAAPWKGPSEEEIVDIIYSAMQRHMDQHRQSAFEDAEAAARAILALLTPADRGETR
jgi:hypothetical protein